MPFDGTEGKKISLRKARAMVAAHRASRSFAKAPRAARIKGGFYGKRTILKILNQSGCVGLRYFHALNARKQPVIVLVGEDRRGNLLTGLMVNEGPICPPICDRSGELGD